MKKEELIAKLSSIIADVLEHTNFEMTEELTASDVDGWDSLAQLMIVTNIEKEFKIKFNLNELYELDNLGRLIELTNTKIDQ